MFVLDTTYPIDIFDGSIFGKYEDSVRVVVFAPERALDEVTVEAIFANNLLTFSRFEDEFLQLISPEEENDQNHIYDIIILNFKAIDTLAVITSRITEIINKQFVDDENCSDFVSFAVKDKLGKKYFFTFTLQDCDTFSNISKLFMDIGMENIDQILVLVSSDSQIMVDVINGVNYTRHSHFRMRVDFCESLLNSLFFEK
jgi:hypothetical protein